MKDLAQFSDFIQSKVGADLLEIYSIQMMRKWFYIGYTDKLQDAELSVSYSAQGICYMAGWKAQLPDAFTIARGFSDLLKAEIGPNLLRAAVGLNKTDTYKDCCCSHDFCDANMVMLNAFENAGLKLNISTQSLWNEAWEIARELEFFTLYN